MNLVKCENVVDLVLFVCTKCPNWKAQKSITWDFYSYICSGDWTELKQDNQSYEDRYKEVEGDILYNIKKHEPYLGINYEELQNFNFVQTDEKEDNAEF